MLPAIFLSFSLTMPQLEAEGQNLKAIQDYWNSGAADGTSNFHLHRAQSSQMDCDPGPVLQIGYS